jgi:hypothetical protein
MMAHPTLLIAKLRRTQFFIFYSAWENIALSYPFSPFFYWIAGIFESREKGPDN